jgi:short-chain fatty acids transporter
MARVHDVRDSQTFLAALGLKLSDFFEEWFPDAFSLALVAVAIVFVAAVGVGSSPIQAAQWFGAGYWDLTAFHAADVAHHHHRLRRRGGAARSSG